MISRREWFSTVGAGAGLAAAQPAAKPPSAGAPTIPAVDFQYSPLQYQTAFCYPDDPRKSLAGQDGSLRYGFAPGHNLEYFTTVVRFTLGGMEADHVARQELEAPHIPIVRTRIERPRAELLATAFATNSAGEGRVDNVLLEIQARGANSLHAIPLLRIQSRQELRLERAGSGTLIYAGGDSLLLMLDRPARLEDHGTEWILLLPDETPAFLRLPQDGQTAAQIQAGLGRPRELLEETRRFWNGWRAFGEAVSWELPRPYGDFLTACARNIQQAREVRNGRLTFQVGPTVYRGLWVVDGNFILEAARYLGYDEQARQGLETTWGYQRPDGNVVAGGGEQHWKDTAIAMFTLVRQAELSGNWDYFTRLQADVLRGVEFLDGLREKARQEGSPNGRYGLLARGFADGGMSFGAEVTNTLWALAGLKAVAEAPAAGAAVAPAGKLYRELHAAFDAAASREMRRHAAGFDYLHMLLREDPLWSASEWDRPRPQSAQWALSQTIYPGVVFAPDDPVVRGHMALMQACTREDVPIETGWIHHEGLWTYNAPFAAHVYLWAGLRDWALRTFHGFLNHASPLYCWREEQPLRGSALARYVGDMPHNWASAECVLFLRHMLALEDGARLRLLAGIGESGLARRERYALGGSPTRFGRIRLALEPSGKSWRLHFERGAGRAPGTIEIPTLLGGRLRLAGVTGASTTTSAGRTLVDPKAPSWTAVWS